MFNYDRPPFERDDFHDFFRGGRHRMGRGDISPIVLQVLLEKPMHGYEIIRRLEEKSFGFWRPSAGSIYPTLQLLEEQELVKSHEEDGKKIYTITDEGRKVCKDSHWDQQPGWKDYMHKGRRLGILKDVARECMVHMKAIGMYGTDAQLEEAKQVIEKTVEELREIAKKVHL